jgi:trk system potassium uptake protein TrkA/voltage-gated potassium channel
MVANLPGLLASPLRNLLAGVAYLLLVATGATLAYAACGWPVGDAFFMVITTVFTVGYGEIRPLDSALLRGITVALILLGCTGMIFVTGALVQLITASQFQQILGTRRMNKDIAALSGHVIVCGYGRIGQMVVRELRAARLACVVLERDDARVALAVEHGFLAMQADATDEDTLRAAGVDRARVLATVLPNDAANVFITLSARSLNRALTIIARGEAPSTENKLLQAGADRVVLPAHIGAERVAELILYNDMSRLLQGAGAPGDPGRDLRRMGLELEVVSAEPGSRCVGLSVAELETEAAGAFLVVGLNRAAGGSMLQPPGDAVIEAGDGLALVGRPGRAKAVGALFGV